MCSIAASNPSLCAPDSAQRLLEPGTSPASNSTSKFLCRRVLQYHVPSRFLSASISRQNRASKKGCPVNYTRLLRMSMTLQKLSFKLLTSFALAAQSFIQNYSTHCEDAFIGQSLSFCLSQTRLELDLSAATVSLLRGLFPLLWITLRNKRAATGGHYGNIRTSDAIDMSTSQMSPWKYLIVERHSRSMTRLVQLLLASLQWISLTYGICNFTVNSALELVRSWL
jgi:hypothetical protein